MTKKNKVLEMYKKDPTMSRIDIARGAGCSPAYVTNTLGAVRPYTYKFKPCEGCENETCRISGCTAA